MTKNTFRRGGRCYKMIFCPYVMRNGKKIYPKRAKVFRFPVEIPCESCQEDCGK